MDKPAILSNPEAFVVVPVEPIREQWAAMADTLYRYKNRHHDKVVGDVFNALLSARPDPTAIADIVAYCAALEAENELLSDRIAILGHEREGLTWTALTHDLNRNTSEERAVAAEARVAELEARLAGEDDWTVADTDTAREILNNLGIGDDASKEPGADHRRDRVAKIIRLRLDAAYRKGGEDMRERAAAYHEERVRQIRADSRNYTSSLYFKQPALAESNSHEKSAADIRKLEPKPPARISPAVDNGDSP